MNNEENKTTITPVVEGDGVVTTTSPVANEPVVQTITNNGGNQDPVSNENDDKGYVKIRVDRAKEQTTTAILKELGVTNLDEAKKKMADGTKALEEVAKLTAKIEAQEQENIVRTKRQLLTTVLDEQKVFDTDALINYIDLDKVEIENGQVKDVENIVASLKKAKPNFFGKFQTVTDGYIKGQESKPMTALEKQKSGNNVGAINDYLKSILK
jgi:hypothetical protein